MSLVYGIFRIYGDGKIHRVLGGNLRSMYTAEEADEIVQALREESRRPSHVMQFVKLLVSPRVQNALYPTGYVEYSGG